MKLHPVLNPSRFFRTRNSIPVEELELVNCENCQQEFKGHFCPNCGQEVAEFNRPFGFVVYDFLGNFFAFDTRFFRTFKFLLIKPGFLTNEFFAGRRVRYSPPFRNFVFLSFILFILLQILTEQGLDKVGDLKMDESSVKVETVSGEVLDPSPTASIETPTVAVVFNQDSVSQIQAKPQENDSVKLKTNGLDLDFSIYGTKNIRGYLNQLADQIQTKLNSTTDPKLREKYISYLVMCRAPEIVISNMLKHLSWAFFILLPLFALIMKMFYLRRKQLYIKHLIFSIHFHTYLFFILIIVTSLKLLFDSGISEIIGVLLLTVPVYFIIAMRKFYGQNFGKIILKFIGTSFIYNILLVSAVLYSFLSSLNFI